MGLPLKQLEAEALQLPPEERARLAHRLLASLDEGADTDPPAVERARDEEIRNRLAEVEAGTAELIPAEQVFPEIRAREPDPDRIAERADRDLPLSGASLPDEYFYASVPLCVIDSVYSIGVLYEGVRSVVRRYCEHTGMERYRANRRELPPREAQESVSAFLERFDRKGLEGMTATVFQNRQRTSTRNGILKAEAVRRFASVLHAHGIEHLQDVPAAMDDERLERDIRAIPGQRSGISLRYFWMLAGSDDHVKPDRMVLRFLQAALGRDVTVTEAQPLLAAATTRLRDRHPDLTPRLLDYLIWQHQRQRKGAVAEDPQHLTLRVTNKAEFGEFLAALAADARRNAATWENNDLPRFLEALAAWHCDAEGYYRNTGQAVDAEAPSWRLFADMLSAARVYE